MHRSYSIRTKILGIIAGGFVLTALGVVLLAHNRLQSIVDRSQRMIYEEKTLTIIAELDQKVKRLQMTGQVEAYEEAFKASILRKLRATYYAEKGLRIYPFIIDAGGAVVMHPRLQRGDETLAAQPYIGQILTSKSTAFEYSNDLDEKRWCITKSFEPWDWIVGFSIPQDIKYAEVRALLNMLIFVIVVINGVVLILLLAVIAKILRPIFSLQEASSAIAAGRLDQEIDVKSNDELGALADSFIKMRNSIREQISDLKRENSERISAVKALRVSEEKYRILVENANDAIFIAQDGVVKFPNQKTEQLTGYTAEELGTMPFVDFIHPDDRETVMKRHTLRLKGENPISTYSFRIVRKSGTEKNVQVNTVLVQWENHPATLNFLRDMTQQIELESRLQQAQKMEAIGTLAGGIAHDFNNILSAVLGYSELALAELSPDDPMRNNLEAIHSSGERARDLVTQILAFSHKDEHVSAPVALHMVIKDSLKLLRPAIPTTIDIQTDIGSECYVLGDFSRLQRIIMNLCTNAYQAMLETGGVLGISLSATKLSHNEAAISQLPAGTYAEMVVSDTGVGIPSEYIKRIFDPYFTTKEKGKGTGLGLAAVHGIVKSHDGAISVTSQPGKGTVFKVFIPLSGEIGDKFEAAKLPAFGGKEHILLVDDEKDILAIQKKMLERQGYSVTAQNNAVEALEAFSNDATRFDLVVTDMTMPMMTGDKLAVELIKIRPDIPIILCTGFSELMSKSKAEEIGIKDLLMKPISMSDLSKMIRTILDQQKDGSPA